MTRDTDSADEDDPLARSINGSDQLAERVDTTSGFESVITLRNSRIDRPTNAHGGPDVELDDPYSLSIVYPLETHRTKKLLS